MDEFKVDGDLVRMLAALLEETGLTEIEYETGGRRIRVARNPAPAGSTGQAVIKAAHGERAGGGVEEAELVHPGAVTSPMVGTAYLTPEPGAEPFVRAGSEVREGETLLLIEAMKTFNPIRAPRSGRVTRIFVGDGAPVEYGEVLLILE